MPAWLHSWLSDLCNTTPQCPGTTRGQGHEGPWWHRPASPRASLVHWFTPSNRSFCKTQAHEGAEAETSNWSFSSSIWKHLLVAHESTTKTLARNLPWLSANHHTVRGPRQANQVLLQNYLVHWNFVLIFQCSIWEAFCRNTWWVHLTPQLIFTPITHHWFIDIRCLK